jgi:NAD(P)-dependent dehydrogenase (short-subunit alcohol dehydrogenase family)
MATLELTGKTVLLTGATDGLGRVLAADLAGRGSTLLLHGRDEDRGSITLTEVADATGSDRLSWYRAGLASLAEVRGLAEDVGRDHDRLDVLVSNAGVGSDVPGGGARRKSADGVELRFAVNYLAGFALTHLLWPQLADVETCLERALPVPLTCLRCPRYLAVDAPRRAASARPRRRTGPTPCGPAAARPSRRSPHLSGPWVVVHGRCGSTTPSSVSLPAQEH